MDISSGAAVAALLLDEHDCNQSNEIVATHKQNVDGINKLENENKQSSFRVLDLCCAPGTFVQCIEFTFIDCQYYQKCFSFIHSWSLFFCFVS